MRKISYGEGVERVFPVYSPTIESISVVKKGKVRRAKLYYLRDRRGKSARIAEKIDVNRQKAKEVSQPEATGEENESKINPEPTNEDFTLNYKLLKELCETPSVAGREVRIRNFIHEHVKDLF